MPRVNRDLQRRMAARRERERRRPAADRSYRFAPPPESAVGQEAVRDTSAVESDEAAVRALDSATRRSRSARGGPVDGLQAVSSTRGGRPAVVHQPFSAFKDEYAYVIGDLRRVGLVIGSLLVVLILLYFVLPH